MTRSIRLSALNLAVLALLLIAPGIAVANMGYAIENLEQVLDPEQDDVWTSTKVAAIQRLQRTPTNPEEQVQAIRVLQTVVAGRFDVDEPYYESQLYRLLDEQRRLAQRAAEDGHTGSSYERLGEVNDQISRVRDLLNCNSTLVAESLDAIASYTSNAAREAIAEGFESRDEKVAHAMIEVAGRQGSHEYLEPLREMWRRARSGSTKAHLLSTLRRIDAEACTSVFVEATEERDELLRILAVRALRLIRTRASIDALVAAGLAEREQRDPSMRLQYDIVAALKDLTGMNNMGTDPEDWQAWWEENRAGFQFPQANPRMRPGLRESNENDDGGGSVVSFYGLPVLTTKPVFVIDTSGSMLEAADPNDAQTNEVGDPTAAEPGKQKWDRAKRELYGVLRSLDEMDEPTTFGLVWYSSEAEAFRNGNMMDANRRNLQAVEHSIESISPVGRTNIYEAIERAFRVCTGQNGRNEVLSGREIELYGDTIFFITDGAPTIGPFLDGVPPTDATAQIYCDKLLDRIDEWNQTRNIVIHGICIGDGNTTFMEALADRNQGLYRHVVGLR